MGVRLLAVRVAIDLGPVVNESAARLKFLKKFARLKKPSSMSVCALMGVLLVGAAVGNGLRADGRRGAFADRCAQEILDQLRGRTWLVTDGLLDNHLAALAAAEGRTLRVLDLAADHDARQVRQLSQWVAADPHMQAERARLLNAASLGVGTFVREWLAAEPDAHQALALYGVPDFWTEAGLTVCPDRFLFLAARSPDGLRSRPLLEEHRAFWKRMCQVLPAAREERDPADLWRHLLRRHLSLVANDLGVALTELGRPTEAYDALEEALVLEPDNLSAKLNQMELVQGGVHPEAKEKLVASVKAAFADLKRQPATFEIVRACGQIHSPQALASVGAAWARLGQYGFAQGLLGRAAALAEDQKSRMNFKTSLGQIRLTVHDTVQSEADFRALLKSQPDSSPALLGMLNLALLRDDPAEARNWLDQARRSGVGAEILELTAARIEIAERKYDACCARMRELTEKKPQYLDAWAQLAVAMIYLGRTIDVELQVLPKMEAVVNRQPNTLVYQVRGAVACAKGPASYGAARDAYRNALALQPGQLEVQEVILELDLAMGDSASVSKDAGDLLRADRDNARAHLALGTQADVRGDLEAAEWHLRKSVASGATATAWNNLAVLLRKKGSLVEAEMAARQAVAKADKSVPFLDTLADVLLEKGQTDAAKAVVGRARSLAPDDWQVAFTAARVLKRAGQTEEARVLLRQVQEHLKAMLTAALVLGCVCGTHAYEVYNNFGGAHLTDSITTDHVEYRVVVGASEVLSSFEFYTSKAITPLSIYARDSLGQTLGVGSGLASAPSPVIYAFRAPFSPDGTIGAPTGFAADEQGGSGISFATASLGPGTYYFGYTVANGTYGLFNSGFALEGSSEQFEDPAQAVNSGLGEIHGLEEAPVPEPTSFALFGLGIAVLALRRRVLKA